MAEADLLPSLFIIISGAASRRTIRMIWVKATHFAGVTSIADIKEYVNEQPKKLKRALQRMIQVKTPTVRLFPE